MRSFKISSSLTTLYSSFELFSSITSTFHYHVLSLFIFGAELGVSLYLALSSIAKGF